MERFRLLSPTWHGVLDYAAAMALVVLPILLGFTGTALWLSVAGAAALVGYSLLTDYRLGVAAILSFRGHLLADLLAAAGFALAPLVFGWSGVVAIYYWVMASGVLAVVALSETREPREFIRVEGTCCGGIRSADGPRAVSYGGGDRPARR